MKKLICIWLLSVCFLPLFAQQFSTQSAEDYYKRGNLKYDSGNAQGAIHKFRSCYLLIGKWVDTLWNMSKRVK